MAKIILSPIARVRYIKCIKETTPLIPDKNYRLNTILKRLQNWKADYILIGTDFDHMSFTFREQYSDGRTGICGGIIYHGPRDNYGSGSAPTFSVSLDKTTGYQIHT